MRGHKFKFNCSIDVNHTKGKLFNDYCGVCPICGAKGTSDPIKIKPETIQDFTSNIVEMSDD